MFCDLFEISDLDNLNLHYKYIYIYIYIIKCRHIVSKWASQKKFKYLGRFILENPK